VETLAQNNRFDELRRIESIKGQTGKGSLSAVAGRRSVIVQKLKTVRWGGLNFQPFFAMVAAGYDFERANPESLSLEGYGSLYEASWLVLEARYILCFLFEYVATLPSLICIQMMAF